MAGLSGAYLLDVDGADESFLKEVRVAWVDSTRKAEDTFDKMPLAHVPFGGSDMRWRLQVGRPQNTSRYTTLSESQYPVGGGYFPSIEMVVTIGRAMGTAQVDTTTNPFSQGGSENAYVDAAQAADAAIRNMLDDMARKRAYGQFTQRGILGIVAAVNGSTITITRASGNINAWQGLDGPVQSGVETGCQLDIRAAAINGASRVSGAADGQYHVRNVNFQTATITLNSTTNISPGDYVWEYGALDSAAAGATILSWYQLEDCANASTNASLFGVDSSTNSLFLPYNVSSFGQITPDKWDTQIRKINQFIGFRMSKVSLTAFMYPDVMAAIGAYNVANTMHTDQDRAFQLPTSINMDTGFARVDRVLCQYVPNGRIIGFADARTNEERTEPELLDPTSVQPKHAVMFMTPPGYEVPKMRAQNGQFFYDVYGTTKKKGHADLYGQTVPLIRRGLFRIDGITVPDSTGQSA